MLERALVALRLGGSTNSGPSSNQVEHQRRLDDPEDNTEDNLDWEPKAQGLQVTRRLQLLMIRGWFCC